MAALKKAGTAQNVKTYTRHGAGKKLFGVSFANLYTLQKQIGVDHSLAEQLWKSDNSDAQTLATLIADPQKVSKKQANAWAKDIQKKQYYMLCFMLSQLVAKTPHAEDLMWTWMKNKKEYIKECGYDVLASMLRDGKELKKSDYRKILKTIEKEIGKAPNRAKHAMNGGLMAIGIYTGLEKEAMAAAKRIGKVVVDHGKTECKTPEAIPYIQKGLKRRK
jgi:3-methyladenine DNA glycosylase AlkD